MSVNNIKKSMDEVEIYYDNDVKEIDLDNKRIAIIGYGIQGKAQALNLRDSGCNVIVGNIEDDSYLEAERDGFKVYSISEAVEMSSVIFFLIPDQAQAKVYNDCIVKNISKNDLLIFAHGYSIHYKKIIPPKYIDVCLLAPRMPGKPIRDSYLNGSGVPAFFDVLQNNSGIAKEIILTLSKKIGFTRVGLLRTSFKEETELDLFIEHFLLPIIIRSIDLSFKILSEEGYNPIASLMELYASGEIGKLLTYAADIGIYKVWENHASPTCQFGIMRNYDKIINERDTKPLIKNILEEIRNGKFDYDLDSEAKNNYSNLRQYIDKNNNSELTKTQKIISSLFKYKENRKEG